MTRATRLLVWILGVMLAAAAVVFAFRWFGALFVLVSLVVFACRSDLRTEEMAAVVLIGFLFCSLLPIDISSTSRRGLPKLMRVYYGKPGQKLRDQAGKGEIVLGGCVVRGYDPLW